MFRIWFNLVMSPIWFLLAVVAIPWVVEYAFSSEKTDSFLNETGPFILIVGLSSMFFNLLMCSTHDKYNIFSRGWYVNTNIFLEILGGLVTGVTMAILYFAFFAELQPIFQESFGDYVQTGETALFLVQKPILFLIANVMLAPFVEQSLFFNYALRNLQPQFKPLERILITATFFGLMHWMSGIWFIVMNGLLVGVPFAFIAEKRKNIVWTFTAHTTLNLLEVVYFYY